MVAERLIGWGITNANGVATLDHAPDGTALSHSYTGVGAGQVQVVAKSGNLQSEIFSVLDCKFYDEGTSVLDTWTENQITSRTLDTDHIVLKDLDSTSGSIYRACDCDVVLEVDLYQVDGGNSRGLLSFRSGSTSLATIDNASLGLTNGEWHTFKGVFSSDGTVTWSNTENSTTKTDTFTYDSGASYRLYVQLGGNCTELWYKNLKVYPI